MILDPAKLSARERYFLMIGAIVPRPIAFVSTVSAGGAANVAPMSFFNGVSSTPPIVSVSLAARRGEKKDTLRNIEETGEFVVNAVDEALAEKMNLASGDYPPEVSEFDAAGLAPVPSEIVRAPRVSESPISFECRLVRTVEIGEHPHRTALVLGEVLCIHARDSLLLDEKHVDPEQLRAIGKMGGHLYCRTRDRFEMKRPKV
ncbi:MAG: flavin reductase family protein [Candidatus Eisenbacteria bacterium]